MANLSISEIVTIAVVILIIFGPNRLPEMARRAGQLLAKFRETAATLKTELSGEFEEIAQPFKDIEADLRAAKDDLTGTAKDIQASIPRLDGTVAAPADPELPKDAPVEPTSSDQSQASLDPVPSPGPGAVPDTPTATDEGAGPTEAEGEPEAGGESDVQGDEKA